MRAVLERYLELQRAESRSARAELEQLTSLLADAATRLAASMERLSALAARAPTCVQPRPAANDGPDCARDPAGVRTQRDEAETVRGEAVSALQFQDIASQLARHTAARLEAMDRLASALAGLSDVPAGNWDEALAAARGAQRASPVGQSGLVAGEIELFQR